MRRILALLAAALATLPSVTTVVHAEASATVFMFVRDGSRDLDLMLTREVGVIRDMLEEAGFEVDIATASGEAMHADTVSLEPTVRLEDVDLGKYAGVVLPCMAPARGFGVPAELEDIVRQAVRLGMPIAASRGSVETLARAGGVDGRRYAFASEVDLGKHPEFLGGVYEGTGVVRDGNISTAGICPLASRSLGEPDGTAELMRKFIASLPDRG